MAVVQAVRPAEFRILGPISVLVEGDPVALGGPKQRAILGALLLRAGTAIGVEELIDAVWGDTPPPTAGKSVQVSITNLRRLLGRERIRTYGAAYALEIGDGELDAHRFEELAAEGSAALKDGGYARASEVLAGALALWRGRVCEDVSFESHVNAEAERLEELRRAALHDRVEADLALGRHAQLVPELERLVALHPLDEELRAQHMLALYRSGRQGDALQAYQDARRLLVGELGVEPGDRLRILQRSILKQDPRLAVPEQPGSRAAGAPVSAARSRRRYLFAAGVVLALAAAGALAVAESGGSRGQQTIAADSVGLLDVNSGRVATNAPAGAEPSAVAYAEDSAWVADAGGDTVARIARGGRVADTIHVGGNVTGIASSGDAVWAVSGERQELVQIDPVTDRVVRRIGVGNGPRAVAVGAGAVWVANGIDGTISRFDLGSRRLTAIRVGGTPAALAFGNGALWVANQDTNSVLRLDPTSNLITSVAVGHGPDAIAAGAGSVWVANGLDGTASRIDPSTASVIVTQRVGPDPTAVALDGGSVWVGGGGAGSLTELAARTGDLVRRVRIGNSPSALAAAGHHLWVAAVASPRSRRGGTLRLLGNTGNPGDPLPSFDPLDWTADTWAVLAITNDGLLGYRRVGGVEGDDVGPDLAQSMPTTSAGGRSYTFTLRPGIRYSDGRPLRASDVRASIERVYRLAPWITAFPLGLVGEAACLKHSRHCDLSRGIETNDRTRTVTFHLDRPNPDFLRVLALPVWDVLPAGAPIGSHLATGPYRVASLKGGRLLLVRNRRFREWSAEVQPQGFPYRISWNLETSPAKGAREVLAGRADVLMPAPPGLSSLAVRDPALLHSDRDGFVRYLFLNTKLAPFDSPDVRRALNLAIDRSEAVTASGGTFSSEPTCEVLPPNMAGYQPYCPYTEHAGPTGAWSAPAILRAQRLVARSGTRGRRVGVWTQSDRAYAMAIGRYVVSLLRSLGYRAFLVARPVDPPPNVPGYYDLLATSGARAQIGIFDWNAAYPSPANFFQPLLTCRGSFNVSRFCSSRIDTLIAHQQWTDAERAVVDQAPLVPLVAERQVNLVSRRVGNYEYSPALGGPLLDQIWVSHDSLSVP